MKHKFENGCMIIPHDEWMEFRRTVWEFIAALHSDPAGREVLQLPRIQSAEAVLQQAMKDSL